MASSGHVAVVPVLRPNVMGQRGGWCCVPSVATNAVHMRLIIGMNALRVMNRDRKEVFMSDPKTGEVWGDPIDPLTWRLVLWSHEVSIGCQMFGCQRHYILSVADWQSRVASFGFVNITKLLEGK
jgi:hypothetical protein